MAVSYKKVAYGGVVVGVDRLLDGVFDMSFGVPPPDADAALWAEYRTNEHFLRYEADVAAGAPVADPDVVVTYTGHQLPEARIATNDATPAEVFRRTLASMTAYVALVDLIGIDAGNGAMRYVRATVAAKRLGAGALLVGAPVVLANHQDTAASAWALAANVSGNDFVITAAGAAGRTVNWFVRVAVDSFAPGGA
jgi:predicted methyltransferase